MAQRWVRVAAGTALALTLGIRWDAMAVAAGNADAVLPPSLLLLPPQSGAKDDV